MNKKTKVRQKPEFQFRRMLTALKLALAGDNDTYILYPQILKINLTRSTKGGFGFEQEWVPASEAHEMCPSISGSEIEFYVIEVPAFEVAHGRQRWYIQHPCKLAAMFRASMGQLA